MAEEVIADKFARILGFMSKSLLVIILWAIAFGGSQVLEPVKAEGATQAIIEAFGNHDVVMLAEWHADKQEHEWLRQLVSTPEFADRVDDIVMEFGNSLYQRSVDRYVGGENVAFEQVAKAWRNTIASVGAPSPVYELLYKTVRETNLKRQGKHQMRIVCGDPYIDWDKVRTFEDIGPYLGNRDKWYAQVVKTEVLAKKHRALLVAGGSHFLRVNGIGYIERELRDAGANPFLVALGTNTVRGYDDQDPRFDSWPKPAIVTLANNWVGKLPAMPVLRAGTQPPTPLKLEQAADALLYVGPRAMLRHTFMPRSELEGTAYGKEITRRQRIEFGEPLKPEDAAERPEFETLPDKGNTRLPLPMPKSIGDPLPPRPPSQ